MMFFKPRPKYEFTIVAIPRSRRVGRIAFGIIYASMGLLFMTVAGGGSPSYYFGTLALLLGAAYFIWAIRSTQEPQLTQAGAAAQAAGEAPAKARAEEFDVVLQTAFAGIGQIVGGLAGLVTFVAVYTAAVDSVGWVIGIALGWIPAGLAAALAFFVGRYLWWLVAIFAFALLYH